MKCYNHPERDAVGMCSVCGKFLCKECVDKHSPIMCNECYENSLQNIRAQRQQQEAEIRTDLKHDVRHFFFLMGIGFLVAWGYYALLDDRFSISAIECLICFFIPYAFYGIRNIIGPGGGCLMFILKYIVAWFVGFLFYGYQLIMLGRRIRMNEENASTGVARESIFFIANLVLILILLVIMFTFIVKK